MTGLRHLQRLALAATLFVVVLHLGRPIEAFDTGWNLRLGQWMWEQGRLLDQDPFLSTSHYPVIPDITADQEQLSEDYMPLSDRFHWLGQVLLYLSYRAAGIPGLMLFRFGCLVATLIGIAWSLRLLEVPKMWRLAAIAGAAAWIGPLVLVRPSAISVVLCAASTAVWLDACRHRSPGRAWIAVAMLPIWAQLHAGFVLGQAIAAAFIVGLIVDRWLPQHLVGDRRLAPLPLGHLAALGAVAAAGPFLLHPAGLGTALRTFVAWSDTAAMLSPDVMSMEMAPASLKAQPMTWLLAAIALLVLPQILRRYGAALVLLTAGSVAAAILSQRNATFLATTSLPVITATVARLLENRERQGEQRRLIETILPLALCLALATAGVAKAASGALEWRVGWGSAHPVELTRFLRQTPPPGRPFNVYHQGGFLVWRVPAIQWFVDGRFVNARFLYVYRKFRKAQVAGAPNPAWRRLFEYYGIDWAVVPAVRNVPDIELIILLSRAPEWWCVRIEDGTTVFVREKDSTMTYLERHRLSLKELQRGMEELFPSVAALSITAGPLLGADYLVSMGAIGAAQELLAGIPAEAPGYKAAQQRLQRWPAYVLPVVDKLAVLEGGEQYGRLVDELRGQLDSR